MTFIRMSDRLTIAMSQLIPGELRSEVPEAVRGISSHTVESVPPSGVLLLMAHPGPCVLIDAAAKTGVTYLQVLDPATWPPRVRGGPGNDVVFLGASRSEILWRAAQALEHKGGHQAAPLPPALRDDGLCWAGQFVPLSATEVRITERLIEGGGALVSRGELNQLIGHRASDRRAVEAHLYRLRHKLRDLPGLRLETVRQRGYRLDLDGPALDTDRSAPGSCH